MTEMIDTHETDDLRTLASGGGGAAAMATPASNAASPVARAAQQLQLLSIEARSAVLERMDPAIAEQIRRQLESMTDSNDIPNQRKMLRDMSERIYASNAKRATDLAEAQSKYAARPAQAVSPIAMGASAGAAPAAQLVHEDPLDSLRVLHPAAIARAMQGERAEAWAVVLDRLDVNARGALQTYLEPSARAAIADARARQSELRATAPQLLDTIEAAIARTVVPRAMREHHYLLSTSPATWEAPVAGMEASWQHA